MSSKMSNIPFISSYSDIRAEMNDDLQYTEDDFDDDDEEYETSYGDVIVDNNSDPEITEVEPPETVDSGLSISDLI